MTAASEPRPDRDPLHRGRRPERLFVGHAQRPLHVAQLGARQKAERAHAPTKPVREHGVRGVGACDEKAPPGPDHDGTLARRSPRFAQLVHKLVDALWRAGPRKRRVAREQARARAGAAQAKAHRQGHDREERERDRQRKVCAQHACADDGGREDGHERRRARQPKCRGSGHASSRLVASHSEHDLARDIAAQKNLIFWICTFSNREENSGGGTSVPFGGEGGCLQMCARGGVK